MPRPEWDPQPELDLPEGVDLNLTSLIDIVLVLLIIFMVSSAAAVDRASEGSSGVVDLQLPTGVETADEPPRGEVVLQLNADGLLFEGGAATEWRSASKALVERLAKEPDLQVRVEADQRLPYQKVMELVLDLQKLGIRNVGLGTGEK